MILKNWKIMSYCPKGIKLQGNLYNDSVILNGTTLLTAPISIIDFENKIARTVNKKEYILE